MKNRDALIKAKEIIEVNLKDLRTPQRAEIDQLTRGYPLEHAITVLGNLIATFKYEENEQ